MTKTFFRGAACALALCCATMTALAAPPASAAAASALLATLKAGHPRLFASAQRFAQLPRQRDAVSVALRALVLRDAARKLTAPPRHYRNGVQDMDGARAVQGDILALAMAYRLTGERRYASRVRADLLQLSALRDWGNGHFLDVGETALAVAVGYDWIYDQLNAAQRDTIATALAQRALAASLEQAEGPHSWVNGNFNWNPVCHGGLIAAALAIGEREPRLAEQVLARALRNLPLAGAAYSPDGSQPEGTSYWGYGTTFYVLAIEALRGALGSSFGLEAIAGFMKTADFRLQMVGPSGQDFDFSDYHPHPENQPVMLWFARETGRVDLARDEVRTLAQLRRGQASVQWSRHSPFELLWWNPAQDTARKRAPRALQWRAGGALPVGVMRSSWTDPMATWLAIKGGTPTYSHAHMDVGSFVLEARGVRWALDLGTEDYDRMRAAGLALWDYTQDSTRWSTFRAGADGHNILRLNGARQRVDGKGDIVALAPDGAQAGFRAELSSLYAPAARQVTRTVRLNADRSVSIEDSWSGASEPLEVAFQWLTRARVSRQGNTLRLEQDGQALALTVAQDDVSIRVDDVSAPPGLQNSPNPGLRRIVVTTHTGAGEDGTLSLLATPLALPQRSRVR